MVEPLPTHSSSESPRPSSTGVAVASQLEVQASIQHASATPTRSILSDFARLFFDPGVWGPATAATEFFSLPPFYKFGAVMMSQKQRAGGARCWTVVILAITFAIAWQLVARLSLRRTTRISESSGTGALLTSAAGIGESPVLGEWRLHLVDDPFAVCLDGSKPGYYIRDGRPDNNKWIIHLQGGGWCGSPNTCLDRARGFNPWGQPSLGGSSTWPARAVCPDSTAPPCVSDGGDHGILSQDPAINPEWAGATAVFVGYCDGGGFAGRREEPLVVNGTSVFLRGAHVLKALIQDLLPHTTGATDVLLKGCSAGGQAVLMHANYIAGLFRAAGVLRVSALVSAGVFLDIPSLSGANTMLPFTANIFTLHHAQESLPQACVTRPPPGLSPVHCAISRLLLAAVDPTLPLFVSQFAADAAQISWVMGLRCDASQKFAAPPYTRVGSNPCNTRKIAYLNSFRAGMVDALARVLLSGSPQYGAWIAECSHHIISNSDEAWSKMLVQSQTQRDTFSAWYAGAFQASVSATQAAGAGDGIVSPRVVDGDWGSNPTCALYSGT